MNAPVKGSRGSDARRDRWTAHRDGRRRQFVDAALRVLDADGPELLIDAVAAEAGVSKPVLYRYFSDKAELVEALAARGSEFLRARLLPAIHSNGPVLDRIAGAVGAYFAVIDEHPNLYWLIARRRTAETGHDGGTVHPDKETIASALAAVISDYLWVFGLDSGAAEPWAHGVTGLVQSTGEWWLHRRSMSRAHVVEYVTQLIWAALTGVLDQAGIEVDPDKPLPVARPRLTVRRADQA
ncbi:MAG TPA: TetR/AcrR family transcriptional regulator [Streptosporangiaceae bacterium]|nr:TetR/AcrR family transcriptional regulator [Streptosporangiaceae bacterium]